MALLAEKKEQRHTVTTTTTTTTTRHGLLAGRLRPPVYLLTQRITHPNHSPLQRDGAAAHNPSKIYSSIHG
jgi:hypothetical protein